MAKKSICRLNDAHRALLSAAAERKDGLIVQPEHLPAPAFRKAGQRLLNGKLAGELRARGTMPVWRIDKDGQPYALKITAAGRRTVEDREGERASAEPAKEVVRTPAQRPRDGSKLALVLDVLQRPEGSTLVALTEATGWQAHTARAALCRLRKGGHRIETAREASGTIYRLASTSEAR
jgi:hypothetical protein